MIAGEIYKSNNSGDMRVINYGGALSVTVEFLNTGYIATTRASHVLSGSVRDKSLLVKPGEVYESNGYGQFKVIEYNGARDVVIMFIATGAKYNVEASNIKSGAIKDYLMPIVFGVGFLGCGRHSSRSNGVDTKCYKAWYGMMTRCYSESYHETRPNYVGCSVSPEWHNFQNFADWYHENIPKDGKPYQLDKDIKIDGNKIYSPSACMFVSLSDNNVKAQAKHYNLTSPAGDSVSIYNMAEFCRDNGLSKVLMGRVANGTAKSHKGWTK
jgi:hypothetical protein